VDKEALDAMKVAVEAAPAVWEMVQEVLAEVMETNVDIRESFALAKIVTKRLGESIVAVQRGDSIADKKTLREDAHLFVKVCFALSWN
jgi:ribose 5-phosphate isomerase